MLSRVPRVASPRSPRLPFPASRVLITRPPSPDAAHSSAVPVPRRAASSGPRADIWYTLTDEAPALAMRALLPVFQRFATPANVRIGVADISVAGRILAANPAAVAAHDKIKAGSQSALDQLASDPRSAAFDWLKFLGEMARSDPRACIVKLPNVSASGPQLARAVHELQSKGYPLPDLDSAEKTGQQIYNGVLGSAVNPVLREGNSDRRASSVVKQDAMKRAKKLGKWEKDSKTHVSSMSEGDFYGSERSVTVANDSTVRIVFNNGAEASKVVRKGVRVQEGEVIDAAFMDVQKLREFYQQEIADAKAKDVLLSLHLKATMMKVSDPIMFGHAVEVFFQEAFQKHRGLFEELGVNSRNGAADVFDHLHALPANHPKRKEADDALADLRHCLEARPRIAMVDSRKGITNLHVPSDVIVDASMPVVIRDSGKMWNADDKLEDTKCLIPDRSYAGVYQAVIDFVKHHGQFDPATMGHVSNVGLMAQKAEEYGSHPNTFEVPAAGRVSVVDETTGEVLFEQMVSAGDIWRMCQTKDEPIRDWVALAVRRARASGDPAIFWLDPLRAHDTQLAAKVKAYLAEQNTEGLDISILPPAEACTVSMERARRGVNTISVTGNVLRDYLTDLFPILELGTSAKMLSIVPLLAGGGVFETGAGGSAPKHVQQFVEENHLRWDSLGEYLAMAVAFEEAGNRSGNLEAIRLGKTLMEATGLVLSNGKSPSRKVGELDNRGTHFYIAMYWAQELAKQDKSFEELAQGLSDNERSIIQDLIECQGVPVNIGGYFLPTEELVIKSMRPSAAFNRLLGV